MENALALVLRRSGGGSGAFNRSQTQQWTIRARKCMNLDVKSLQVMANHYGIKIPPGSTKFQLCSKFANLQAGADEPHYDVTYIVNKKQAEVRQLQSRLSQKKQQRDPEVHRLESQLHDAQLVIVQLQRQSTEFQQQTQAYKDALLRQQQGWERLQQEYKDEIRKLTASAAKSASGSMKNEEIQKWSRQVSIAKSEYKAAEDEIVRLKAEITRINEIHSLDIEAHRAELNRHQHIESKTLEQVNEYKRQLEVLQQQHREVEKNLQLLQEEKRLLTNEKNDLYVKVADLEVKRENLHHNYGLLQRQSDETQSDLQERLDNGNSRIAELESTITKLTDEQKAYEEKLDKAHKKIQEEITTRMNFLKKTSQDNTDVDALKNEFKKKGSKLADMRYFLKKADQEIEAQKLEIEDKELTITKLEKEKAALEREQKDYKEKLDKAHEKIQEEITTRMNFLKKTSQDNAVADAQRNAFKKKLELKIKNMRSFLKKAYKEIEAKELTIAKLETEQKNYEKNLNNAHEKMREEITTRMDLQRQNHQLKGEMDDLRDKLQKAMQDNAAAILHLEDQHRLAIDQLKSTHALDKKDVDDRLDLSEKRRKDLLDLNKALNESANKAFSLLDARRKEIDDLKQNQTLKLKDLEDKIIRLQSEIDRSHQEEKKERDRADGLESQRTQNETTITNLKSHLNDAQNKVQNYNQLVTENATLKQNLSAYTQAVQNMVQAPEPTKSSTLFSTVTNLWSNFFGGSSEQQTTKSFEDELKEQGVTDSELDNIKQLTVEVANAKNRIKTAGNNATAQMQEEYFKALQNLELSIKYLTLSKLKESKQHLVTSKNETDRLKQELDVANRRIATLEAQVGQQTQSHQQASTQFNQTINQHNQLHTEASNLVNDEQQLDIARTQMETLISNNTNKIKLIFTQQSDPQLNLSVIHELFAFATSDKFKAAILGDLLNEPVVDNLAVVRNAENDVSKKTAVANILANIQKKIIERKLKSETGFQKTATWSLINFAKWIRNGSIELQNLQPEEKVVLAALLNIVFDDDINNKIVDQLRDKGVILAEVQ